MTVVVAEIEEWRNGVEVDVDLDAVGRQPPPQVHASLGAELYPKTAWPPKIRQLSP